jgi:hypothetical protein
MGKIGKGPRKVDLSKKSRPYRKKHLFREKILVRSFSEIRDYCLSLLFKLLTRESSLSGKRVRVGRWRVKRGEL